MGDRTQPVYPTLLTPTTVGDMHLKNRIVYPAMTRARFVGGVANDAVVKCMQASMDLCTVLVSRISSDVILRIAPCYSHTPQSDLTLALLHLACRLHCTCIGGYDCHRAIGSE